MRDRSAVWLRVASVLALIHGVLHTIGGVFGAAAPGAQAEALAVMKANRFVAMGGSRTYWDFFFGYGLFLSVSFLVQAVVFWQMAAMAKAGVPSVRGMALTFCVGYVGFAVVAWRYFFVGPVVFELLIAGCLLLAAVGRRDGERLR